MVQVLVLSASSRSIMHTEEHEKNSCDLDLSPITLNFNWL